MFLSDSVYQLQTNDVWTSQFGILVGKTFIIHIHIHMFEHWRLSLLACEKAVGGLRMIAGSFCLPLESFFPSTTRTNSGLHSCHCAEQASQTYHHNHTLNSIVMIFD